MNNFNMTSEEIIDILSNDKWFKYKLASPYIDNNGEQIISASFYHTIADTNYTLVIRVSNHCTYLSTWINVYQKPEKSILNLSVVLSDTPCTYSKQTKPVKYKNKEQYTYFVVEQYQYKLSNLSKSDFKKIINRIKNLEKQNAVYTDPLKNKPNKKANRTVLTPDDLNDNHIHLSTNKVHSRQTIVANNKDKEVDIEGNILEKQLYNKIMRSVSKVLKELLSLS